MLFLLMVGGGMFVLNLTRFGRNIYAVGGNEPSARLMGLPVGATKVGVYTVSGFCSALAGIVATFDMGSGNPANTPGLELDAIAAVVIGGTLLRGGVGSVAGTLIGVLIFGTIQTALNFDGRLNSWWLRIAIGLLLLLFILLQRFLTGFRGRGESVIRNP
jgi:simple sugar transport system permease protein